MSKSANMLRTRRKDNNVKPNRRLDRKSSRGMLFENEELRLKTININAEVERSQSDVKKLKRENDQLRREIWYLRDEYDKLDKLLREKECHQSSSSSCTSESDSCSSCSEESEAVEASQNLENFQKTGFKKLNQEFDQLDHLSVVPEENSGENSDKNSNLPSLPDEDVIKPDQSYPVARVPEKNAKHFFSPIRTKEYENDQFLGPEAPYTRQTYPQGHYHQNVQMGYYGLQLPPLNKSHTDVIVKMDNQDFSMLQSRSSFSNGGNLEELLNDIETISHDILKITNSTTNLHGSGSLHSPEFTSPFPNFRENDFLDSPDALPPDKPYKSELNVVLMPSPMHLIGVEKYMNIQKSCESLENLSASCRNLKIAQETPQTQQDPFMYPPLGPPTSSSPRDHQQPSPREPNFNTQQQNLINETNPFFFGSMRPSDNNGCGGGSEWRPKPQDHKDAEWRPSDSKTKTGEVYNSKTNLLETTASSDHISSENEENLKFKTSRESKEEKVEKAEAKEKASIKHKVSIHFKGKKDKSKAAEKPKSPQVEKKPFFQFTPETKRGLTKTASVDSKLSNLDSKPSDSKTSSDNKTSSKTFESSSSDKQDPKKDKPQDRKNRKSSSASPERKHGHKEAKKHHRKHKKADRGKLRRSSASADRIHRERSYSICTDRSNILDQRYGVYDDFTTSERERTNSLSSCDTVKGRKLSNISHIPTGKIPWCGCWGTGCL